MRVRIPSLIRRSAMRYAVCVLLLAASSFGGNKRNEGNWVATWATATAANDDSPAFANQTLREIVHPTVGGSAVRIRLANTFGAKPVRFDAVYVGLQKEGASLVPGSNHAVTFGGGFSVTIREGAEAVSDPVQLTVEAGQNLAISVFVAGETGHATTHGSAFQTSYFSERGNSASEEGAAAFTKTTESWHFLTAVDVLAPAATRGAIVALGDSITDGASARVDKNERWTDVLAQRLRADHIGMSVLNAGIGGNRVLSSSPCWGANALARLDHDVLAQTGVQAIILFEGTNDIGQPDTKTNEPWGRCLATTHITAEELIEGYKQIIAQAHARGVKIYGATILPYKGYRGWTEAAEPVRVAVNRWIKTAGAFDGVADFDGALADPANPAKMAPQFDSGDHLHSSPAGHEAMGKAIDLAWFR